MIKRFSRVVKELKKTIIRSKALSRDVASIKSSIGGENLVESLASVRDEIARNEKDIKSLYKANKERIKDTINHSRELDKVYLQLAETSLGRKLTFDEYKISWRCVFSSDPILRKRAWEDLYLERRIGLATELKLLSAQYFHGKRDECAGLYVAISSNSVPPEMVEKYFSDGFKNSDRELNEPCEGFREYIKGKGVEVSGPLSGDSIRTQGIVRVAMNVVNSGSGADVSYYSSSVFSKRSTDVFKLLASGELKYAVVNAFNRNKYNFEIPGELVCRVKALCVFEGGFDSHLLGVQRCVFDLLHYDPKLINISGVNFYSKLPYHNASYLRQVTEDEALLRSWSVHDVVFNFLFMQYICRNNTVYVVDESKYLLDMAVIDYVRMLEGNLAEEVGI